MVCGNTKVCLFFGLFQTIKKIVRYSRRFDFNRYKKTWLAFSFLFKNKNNNHLISIALLYYGNTWIRETPYYYENYNCKNWESLVRLESRKYLIELLEDMHDKPIEDLDFIIKSKMQCFFQDKQ